MLNEFGWPKKFRNKWRAFVNNEPYWRYPGTDMLRTAVGVGNRPERSCSYADCLAPQCFSYDLHIFYITRGSGCRVRAAWQQSNSSQVPSLHEHIHTSTTSHPQWPGAERKNPTKKLRWRGVSSTKERSSDWQRSKARRECNVMTDDNCCQRAELQRREENYQWPVIHNVLENQHYAAVKLAHLFLNFTGGLIK